MWGTFFRWLGSNWAGLSAGYTIGDFFAWLNQDDDQAEERKPDNVIDKSQQAVSETIRKFTGLPKWATALITLAMLFLAVRFFTRKK